MCARPGCPNPIPPRELGADGRRRKTCSNACRQAVYRGRKATSLHFSSKSVQWFTPVDVFGELAAECGGFDLDPAADPRAPIWPLVPNHYTVADDGLSKPWNGRVFLNPPYGRIIRAWMRKAADEVVAGHAALVVCLVPARPDTLWWHEALEVGAAPQFRKGRIRFVRPDGTCRDAAGFPSAVLRFRNGFVTRRAA